MATRGVFVFLYLCGIVGCWAQDPCLNPMEVPSLEKRDRDYVVASGERALNDRLLTEGWYDAGDQVPLDSEPGFQRCGTRYPIWRQQKNGDTSTMCVQTHNNKCYRQFNIETKMCGKKEIFYLKKTISSSAYCFAPNFNVKPKVAITLRNYTATSKLEFRCEFSKHADDVFYTTNWVVNGDLVLSEEPLKWDDGNVIESHALTEAKLINESITHVGFEISKRTLKLSEGESANITVELTVPFGCGTVGGTCELLIMSVQIETTDCKQAGLASSKCGTVIFDETWDEPANITVFGQVSQEHRSLTTNVLKLKLVTPDDLLFNKFWNNYTIGVITVQLIKNTTLIDGTNCYATNDPHMLTFDGRNIINEAECSGRVSPRRYEHQYEGTFTMYKHETVPIEVQIKTEHCGGENNAWCNSGVAIRAGWTVFEFSRSTGQVRTWKTEYTLCEDNADVLQVRKTDKSYEVYLPTGGKVSFSVSGEHLNIYIYPSVQDEHQSRGLCGTLTGNCSDDFVLRDGTYSTDVTATGDCDTTYSNWQNLLTTFSNSWIGDKTSDLFDPEVYASLSTWPQTNLYCSCTSDLGSSILTGAVNCTAAIHKVCNTLPGFKDVFPTSCTITERRRRRSAGVRSESPRRLRRQAVNVWTNGWTEVKARTFCENLFQESRSIQACKNVTGVGISGSIDNCVLDIQLTGTTDFSRFSIDTVRDKCLHEVLVDPELQVKNGTTNVSVYDIVMAEACLNDCSGKGTCTNVHMATVVSISHAQCKVVASDNTGSKDVDNVRAYRISIANSAGNYGDSVGLIVFNSTCIRAEGGEAKFNWTVKGPYCLNKGACVPHGARQPGNNCLVCDVSGNKRTWKTGSGSRCQGANGQLLLISVIASVGGVVLLLLLVLAAVCACKRSKREVAGKNFYEVWKKS